VVSGYFIEMQKTACDLAPPRETFRSSGGQVIATIPCIRQDPSRRQKAARTEKMHAAFAMGLSKNVHYA
jgi:hypothetical protein